MTGQEAREDEREALAFRLFLIESGQDEVFLTRVWENHGDGHPVKVSYLRQADALIAAGYRKHPEPEITDGEVARLHGVIGEVRKAWWTATEYNDAGNVVYTDSVEAAMDSIWAAIAEETLGVPVGEGEQ